MASQTRPATMEWTSPASLGAAAIPLRRRFHRHMHGRYFPAFVLGLIAALGGAYAGYISYRPSYRSMGILRITPLTLRILYAQSEIASSVFDSFVDVQINFMRSRPVVAAVLHDPKWLETHPDPPPMEPETFLRNLDITHSPRSELIDVTFTDPTPAGAKAGVGLLIDSYMKINGDQSVNQRIQATQKRGDELTKEMVALSKRMGEITQKYGTDDLKQLHQAKVLQLSRLEEMIMQTEINLVLSESALGNGDTFKNMPIAEIATTDEIMRKLVEESQRTQEKLDDLLLARGKEHPDVVAVRTKLDAIKKDIATRAEEWRKFHRSSFVNNVGVLEGMPTPAAIDALRKRRDNLRQLYEEALQKSLDIGSKSLESANIQEELRKTKERLADNQAKVEQLRVDSSIVGQIMVISSGDMPRAPVKDQRRIMALVGAGAGFALGFSLVGGLAFADRRLRRKADIRWAGFDLPVLGVFPRLRPGRPELAAKAASALHQCMTGLQIDPQLGAIRVFAVSSATRVDGKTEIAAALAIGFAALGKRTLLVDFDHRTASLTHSLTAAPAGAAQNASTKGLLDVLSGVELLACCRRTQAARVSFLPMAGKAAGRIGGLTSAQVRAVLTQAAADFEIVLLDTPPILDGLESTLICKEAESLLVATTPSTSDRVLRRALALVHSASAPVGGILFNQAARKDVRATPLAGAEDLRSFLPSPNGSFVEALVVR